MNVSALNLVPLSNVIGTSPQAAQPPASAEAGSKPDQLKLSVLAKPKHLSQTMSWVNGSVGGLSGVVMTASATALVRGGGAGSGMGAGLAGILLGLPSALVASGAIGGATAAWATESPGWGALIGAGTGAALAAVPALVFPQLRGAAGIAGPLMVISGAVGGGLGVTLDNYFTKKEQAPPKQP